MKCIFSAQFKQLIKEMFIVAIVGSSLVSIALLGIAGLGYVSIHWFDFINLVDVSSNGPIDYYFRQGFYVLMLLVVAMVALVVVYVLIVYPTYYLIRYPKRVLNYIFDCKETK